MLLVDIDFNYTKKALKYITTCTVLLLSVCRYTFIEQQSAGYKKHLVIKFNFI